jgi:hypothetical protein
VGLWEVEFGKKRRNWLIHPGVYVDHGVDPGRLEPLQGLKPTFVLVFIGTTEVVPCYKARFDRVIPQPVIAQ